MRIRGLRAASALAVAVGLFACSGASAATPIEGDWRLTTGEVVRIKAVSGGHEGVIVTPAAPCPPPVGFVLWRNIRGSGTHYTGVIPFVNTFSCQPAFDTTATFDVSADGGSLAIVATPPNGSPPQSFAATRSTQVDVVSSLPVIVNGILVRLQSEYRELEGGKAKSHFRTATSLINSGVKTIKAYKSEAAGDATLKSCSLRALFTAYKGAQKRKRQSVGDGMRSIARCLKPYTSLFSEGKTGFVPPKPNPHKPVTTADGTITPYRGVGLDPNYVPRVDFDVVNPRSGPPYLTNIHVTIRVACLSKGVFYLEAGPEDFPTKVTEAAAGFGITQDIGNVELTVYGTWDAGGAGGAIRATGLVGASDECSSGGHVRNWYAGMGAPHYTSLS